METRKVLANIDLPLFLAVGALILIGLVNIYSASFGESVEEMFRLEASFGKQLLWTGITLFIFVIILILDVRIFINSSYFIYGVTVILLLVTLVIGNVVAGSKSWLIIGPLSLQPSELAKFGTALVIAKFLDGHNVSLNLKRDVIICFILIGFPMGLTVLQNDFGSAMVFSAFIFVLIRQGLHLSFLLLPILFAAIFVAVLLIKIGWIIAFFALIAAFLIYQSNKRTRVILLIVGSLFVVISFMYSVDYVFNNILQPHQQTRINVLLNKVEDKQGAGYNVHQSLIAIGSGGISGKGFLEGTQTKGRFVPEQSTDFIFCTVAEEYGLVGSSILIFLFAFVVIRVIILSERQKFRYNRIYGYAVASIIFFHFVVNVGMTLGMFPVIGIPLPFISYGGSSLLGFTLMIGLFLKLDADFKHYFN